MVSVFAQHFFLDTTKSFPVPKPVLVINLHHQHFESGSQWINLVKCQFEWLVFGALTGM